MNQFQQLIWKTMFAEDWRQFVDVTHCTAKYVADEVPALKMLNGSSHKDAYLCTFIDAPTGSGKNYYITRVLAKEAKKHNRKILVLSNRNILELQQKQEIIADNNYPVISNRDLIKLKTLDNIVFLTYQSVLNTNFIQYFADATPAYIVFDEAHFLCADATFNANTESILYSILSRYPLVPRVYMSATLDVVKPLIMSFEYNLDDIIADPGTKYTYQNVVKIFAPKAPVNTMDEIPKRKLKYKEYRFNPDYQCASIFFFKQWETIINKINQEIETENFDKWLIFVNEKETGKMLYSHFPKAKADFITAELAPNNSTLNSLVNTQQFPKKVLICTSVLDNGISIHDDSLKNIVIDFFDKTEFIQMLGRKRVRENETITVYTRVPTFKDVKTRCMQIGKSAQDFENLEDNPLEFLWSRWGRLSIREQELVSVGFSNSGYLTAGASIFTKYALSTQQAWYDTLNSQLESDPYAYAKQICEWLRKTFSKEEMLKEDISPDDTDIAELRRDVTDIIEDCIKENNISDANSNDYVIPAAAIKNLGNKIQEIIRDSLYSQKQFGVVVDKGAANVRNVIESMELPYELSDKGSGTAKNTYRLSRKPGT